RPLPKHTPCRRAKANSKIVDDRRPEGVQVGNRPAPELVIRLELATVAIGEPVHIVAQATGAFEIVRRLPQQVALGDGRGHSQLGEDFISDPADLSPNVLCPGDQPLVSDNSAGPVPVHWAVRMKECGRWWGTTADEFTPEQSVALGNVAGFHTSTGFSPSIRWSGARTVHRGVAGSV